MTCNNNNIEKKEKNSMNSPEETESIYLSLGSTQSGAPKSIQYTHTYTHTQASYLEIV